MEKIVTWTKGVFDSSYMIFCNGQVCGNLIFETWNNHAFGIMSQKNYHFKRQGFTSSTTIIYGDNSVELGHIAFNFWQMRAVISLKDQEAPFSWNYTNGWLSEWTVSNYKDTQLHYRAATSSGMISGQNLDNELVLLAGFYIKEAFSRVLAMFIIFIALMVIFRGF